MFQRQLLFSLAAWVFCAALGLAAMLTFELTPAKPTQPPAIWPSAATIPMGDAEPTLVLFLHPRCPCSRATLAELNRLLATVGERCALRIVFVIPPGTPANWEKAGLYQAAKNIAGALVLCDSGGVEASQFGVTTSGHLVCYDAGGRLLFQGGLTPSRGHEGDNPGRTALVSHLQNGQSPCSHAAVFGCPLMNVPRP